MNSQILMATGFAVAALAMLATGRRAHAIFFLLAVAESYTQFRYPFHAIMRDHLLAYIHLEGEKTQVQVVLLGGCTVLATLLLLALLPYLARMPAGQQLMTLGTLGVLAMLGVELISLHQIDSMIYHPIGSFALCPIIYAISAVAAAMGALLEARRRQRTGAAAA